MATLTVYADAADGQIYSTDATYSTARTGSGLVASGAGSVMTVGQQTGYYLYESFLSFDTSSIGTGPTISAVDLSMVVAGSGLTGSDFTNEARVKNWGASVDAGDWVAGGSLSALTRVATKTTASGVSTGTRYSFTEDGTNFISNISVSGTTYLMVASDRLAAGTTPSGNEYVSWKSSETAGTTDDPKLVVTYTSVVEVSVAGAQPAAMGEIAALSYKELAGAQPAASGALAADQVLQHAPVAGSQAAPSGALGALRTLYRAVAGAQAAPSGALAFNRLLQHATVQGAQAAPSGALADITIIPGVTLVTVEGAQASPSGALSRQLLLLRTMAGNQPAPSGALAEVYANKQLVGAQAAPAGALALEWLFRRIGLAGAQGAPQGDVGALQQAFASVAGAQPGDSGTIAGHVTLAHLGVAGEQASPAGLIAAHFSLSSVGLAGNQAAASGALVGLYLSKLLAGSQDAPSGTVVGAALQVNVGFGPVAGRAVAGRELAGGRATNLALPGGRAALPKAPGSGRGRLAP